LCCSQQYAFTNFLFLFFKITVLKTIVASKNYIFKKNCIELHEKYTEVEQPVPCKHWRARANTWSTQELLFRTWLWHVWEEDKLPTNCFRFELNYLVAMKYQNRFVYAEIIVAQKCSLQALVKSWCPCSCLPIQISASNNSPFVDCRTRNIDSTLQQSMILGSHVSGFCSPSDVAVSCRSIWPELAKREINIKLSQRLQALVKSGTSLILYFFNHAGSSNNKTD
jgi:hypothetical protein